jgi:hypothetical protein
MPLTDFKAIHRKLFDDSKGRVRNVRSIKELIERDRSQEEGAIDFSIFKDYFERIKKTSA